jgi:hypothetical protein
MRTLALPFVALTACASAMSDAAGAKGADMAEGGGGDVTSAYDSGGADSGDQDGGMPATAWSVRGTLVVADGAATVDGASLFAIGVTGDGAISYECELDLRGLYVAESTDPAIGAWWRVDDVGASDCDGVSGGLAIGVGELDVEVRAQLGAVGLDGVADQLFGAWAAVDDGVAQPIGYADPRVDDDCYDEGTCDAVAALPLPDSAYAVEPLFLLPRTDEE